jgi:hypothetical protein
VDLRFLGLLVVVDSETLAPSSVRLKMDVSSGLFADLLSDGCSTNCDSLTSLVR